MSISSILPTNLIADPFPFLNRGERVYFLYKGYENGFLTIKG
jgi:hypothetical protein